MLSRHHMKRGEWDRAVATAPANVHDRIERRQRDGEIRWMRRDALVARPENRVRPTDAHQRRAPRSGLALVALCCDIPEIRAARTLQNIAADCRHVAHLS